MLPTPAFHAAAERYADWQHLGSGGSAEVWRVSDRDLGIQLAIKLLRPEFATDARQIEALRREVLISRALRHPNICPIHDIYEGPRGVGIVMDLLLGQDLKQWQAAHHGRLLETLPQRLAALRQIADALAIAHKRIVHRDLKPANVFLQDGDIGRPLIMDFGLSVLGATVEAHFVGGTPKYMAPEQYSAPATVDGRADLFSLGILAYELLSDGRIPPHSLQDVIRTGVVPGMPAGGILPLSEYCAAIPPALDQLVLRMLQSDPAARPGTADEVANVLARIDLPPDDRARAGLRARAGGRPSCLPAGMVAVPAGVYEVGSARMGAGLQEKPRRHVKLTGYSIAPTPVTHAEYLVFCGATGLRAPALSDDPRFGSPDAPVVGVSWADASAYAAWTGGRLPTEIEWEVAARAGAVAAEFPWGAAPPLATQANIDRVSDYPTPVASFPTGRNPWGLWDMCGNVWEWCADSWEEYYYRRLAGEPQDPVGRGDGRLRSIRGGSFDSFVSTGRCNFRGKAPAEERRADLGFRLVAGGGHHAG